MEADPSVSQDPAQPVPHAQLVPHANVSEARTTGPRFGVEVCVAVALTALVAVAPTAFVAVGLAVGVVAIPTGVEDGVGVEVRVGVAVRLGRAVGVEVAATPPQPAAVPVLGMISMAPTLGLSATRTKLTLNKPSATATAKVQSRAVFLPTRAKTSRSLRTCCPSMWMSTRRLPTVLYDSSANFKVTS
jgi:hypothetical protein